MTLGVAEETADRVDIIPFENSSFLGVSFRREVDGDGFAKSTSDKCGLVGAFEDKSVSCLDSNMFLSLIYEADGLFSSCGECCGEGVVSSF